ncbi:MAG: D-xylose ABC transporter ATP-binding protein, partial [Tannerella sp.]|nr:D-xylose ABC transporter ATP-binding protein [Tannerella sp.]
LILDDPTKGIDVGAKADIYRLLDDLTAAGVSVILVSSELVEITGICDRTYVMHERKIKGCLEKEAMSQENIMRVATGGQSI